MDKQNMTIEMIGAATFVGAESTFYRLTSRKFLLALATLAAASVLLWFGHIEPLVWRDVVIATVGAYITANVVQRVKAPAA
jgi:hypothetical protein